jgi:hypothetical protein
MSVVGTVEKLVERENQPSPPVALANSNLSPTMLTVEPVEAVILVNCVLLGEAFT